MNDRHKNLTPEESAILETALDSHGPKPWPLDRPTDHFEEIDFSLAVKGGNQHRDEKSVSRLNMILDELEGKERRG